ncbi:hypothetical protein D9619_002949 [Psilocybe cf. subviscida]|uniref:NAD-dependent epimerase/dehydratase domain-containing protein n=1 Tax=Psilocybe cf. subviscida TaxID=2480587 RepID=A0A8H5ETX8_9AGAR|nr:hypothetical protein D9619_002949 [Psilocybe cf. subviscida]
MSRKVVICGAGFLGRHIGQAIANSTHSNCSIQISSRHPQKIHDAIKPNVPPSRLLAPVSVDITKLATLEAAFQDASMVVSLVGIMHGTPAGFEAIQHQGAKNVAIVAKKAGAKLVHFSAIGADSTSSIPYVRTKGLAEQSVLSVDPKATIIRPSLVFGPEDDFFNRFARLASIMPFLPVFGGGVSKFQPVYVGDLARFVEVLSRDDKRTQGRFESNVIEAGGPQTFTYRELMQMVLDVTGRKRPILSLPFELGLLQGAILEKLPVNLFTVTRSQVEQLKSDNIVNPSMPSGHLSLADALSEAGLPPMYSVQDILPTYLR